MSGATVTLLSAGTCTIAADQPGNSMYSPASRVSQSFTIAKASQAINFATPSGKTLGMPAANLSAAANSGLPVAFSSNTPAVCTVVGTALMLLTAGNCTIAADQAGNGNVNPAAQVIRTFAIAKANQTISFGALANQTFGAAPFAVQAWASSGLPITFTSSTTSYCTVSNNIVTLVTPGSCTIVANQAGDSNTNAATPVSKSFTIGKAPQTISFGALALQRMGASPFGLSATATSGLPVAFTSSTPTICTVSGATVTLVKVGTCTLAANQAGNAYTLAAPQVSQSFTVAAALTAQAITGFAPASPIIYSPGSTFTVSAIGGASGNVVTFASTTNAVCTVAGSTVTIQGAGTCILSADQAGNAAYSAAPPVLASVTIHPGSQSISFGALPNQRAGSAPFAISAAASSGLPVTFSSTTTAVCTVADNTVTLIGPGTCTLAASQPGDGNTNAAPGVTQSFQVGWAATGIALGNTHACALTHAGGVQCWGGNGFGQLGNGAGADSNVPVDAVGLTSGMAAVESGTAHSCALTVAGGVKCWGNNDAGQLGDGTTTPSSTARDVVGLSSGVIALTLGAHHTCALQNGGALVCWGDNRFGQLGDGSGIGRLTPVAVTGMAAGVVDVRAGDNHTCAVTGAGAIQCWGQNAEGQLGDGSTNAAASPVGVSGLGSGNLTVEGATRHSCALTAAGGVKCWGNNSAGQLGNGSTTPSLTPVDASGLVTGIAAIVASGDSSCALTTAGADLCWGALAGTNTAQTIAGLGNGVQSIGAGGNFACALTTLGAVLCWGDNGHGQLGDGITLPHSAPAAVAGLTGGNATNQAITFGAVPGKVMGDVPFSLTASASSGLAVAFSSITPSVCTVANATVTLVANGTCTIAANQSGGSGVNAAQPVTQSFRVAPASQTITGFAPATPLAYSAGGTFALSATGGASGNPIAYLTTTPAVCTVAGNTATVQSAGTCALSANQAGNGTYSAAAQVNATVIITPTSQTITFAALSAHTIADASFILSATASSGLIVTFSSTTPAVCTVANGIVTLVAPGTCTLAADQAGTATIAPAPQVTQSFAVTQSTQAITGFYPTAPAYAPGATFGLSASGGASGNPIVFASTTPAICTVTGSTATTLGTGYCTLTANQAGNANYSAAPQVTTMVYIAPAAQTIDFAPLPGVTFGSATVMLSAAASSGLAVTFSSVTGTVCTVSGNAVTLVATGTCILIANQAGGGGYSAAPGVAQSFAVVAGTQTITRFAPTSPLTYRPGATFGLSAGGGASGNPIAFASSTPAICTVAGSTATIVSAGTCMLTANQAGNGRYGAAPQVTASVMIAPAPQSISFATLPLDDATGIVSAVASSGLGVSFASSTTTVCTVTGNTVTQIQVGICTIVANQGGNANYEAAVPVAQSFAVNSATARQQVYFIHSDQLNTPRLITDAGNNVVWQWSNSEAFGANAPNQNPAGLGTFTYNPRFPGQYFDQETGLHYNVNRDFDPIIGRYVESDPIGLAGGLNTYLYVAGNPVSFIDPFGLEICPQWRPSEEPGLEPVCVECIFLGLGRLGYVVTAKAIPSLARTVADGELAQAVWANAARNRLKDVFRGPLKEKLKGWHQPSVPDLLAKGKTLPDIVSSAGKTNLGFNVGAAGIAAAGTVAAGYVNSSSSSSCGCAP